MYQRPQKCSEIHTSQFQDSIKIKGLRTRGRQAKHILPFQQTQHKTHDCEIKELKK